LLLADPSRAWRSWCHKGAPPNGLFEVLVRLGARAA